MGLIKAAASAIGSTMHDQWKEAIICENMTNEVLMVKKTTPNGVISNKSTTIPPKSSKNTKKMSVFSWLATQQNI